MPSNANTYFDDNIAAASKARDNILATPMVKGAAVDTSGFS